MSSPSLHVAVVGAGAFGGWTALWLRRRGCRVTLLDAWGPGHSRSSSGGESRVIRGMYGPDRVYVDWVVRSFEIWAESEARWKARLYHPTGTLWMFGGPDDYARTSLPLLAAAGLPARELDLAEARRRYPQIDFTGITSAFFEERAGWLAARRACRVVAAAVAQEGGEVREAAVRPGPIQGARMERLELSDGSTLEADAYVFAAGPWLPDLFPDLLGNAIHPTRQEIFFFGTPAGDPRFREGALPIWLEMSAAASYYGIPGNDHRGFKIADDVRGEPIDPTTGDRTPTPARLAAARSYIARRFPALAGAPLVESRVCQYENSPDGDFLLDRHPEAGNVWILGGGSGHGFKMGPALGEQAAGWVLGDGAPPARFSLARLAAAAGAPRRTQFDAGRTSTPRRDPMPRRHVFGFALLGLTLFAAAAGSQAPPPAAEPPGRELGTVLEEYWNLRLRDDLATRLALGLAIRQLPDVSEQNARATAAEARRLLARLERIDGAAFSHDDWLSLEIAKWECRQTAALQERFWLSPQLTMSRLPLRTIHTVLAALPLRTRSDLDNYLGLVRQYPGLVRELRKNFEAARSRGILPPRDLIDVVEPILRSFVRKPEEGPLWVAGPRLDGPRKEGATDEQIAAFEAELRRLITAEVDPALRELADAVAAARPQAPERTGLGQYPGGEAAYRDLVRYHTTLEVTPEEIHRIGLEEVERIDRRMAEVRRRLGFEGTRAEFHRKIRTDPRFLARTPDEVGERLMAPVRRIEPKMKDFFLRFPAAPYGVKRLDPAFEGSTFTFGMYEVPTPASPAGLYRFNGSDLSQRPLMNAAALIYHELVPGHHFQINLQMENASLPPFRRTSYHTAYLEGWAEYASELAGEMGLYDDPLDEYGRLGMDMFLSTRLVVDTGMNHLGWPRERAIRYMLDHVLESETQITSETLRYSADMPGQALGYKMGSRKFRELRTRAEKALGEKFDIRRFHDAVLSPGSMPLTVLDKHIDRWIAEEKQRR